MQITELQEKYKNFNLAEKLIAINVVVFIVVGIVSFLFQTQCISEWFALDASFSETLFKPWSILSYAFLHHSFAHLFFNMLMLYYVGKMFLPVFNPKLFLNVYLLGAIVGGLCYLLVYSLFPVFVNAISFLVGASAAVSAILIFFCASFPNQEVSVLSFKIKLWHVGVFFVGFDILMLLSSNTGGHIAHLGGALLGYVYAKQYVKGNDIGKGFEKVMDACVGWFQKSKQPKMKTVYKTRRERNATHKTVYQKNKTHQAQINSILDKISKSGYDSLTKEEKAFLFQSGK